MAATLVLAVDDDVALLKVIERTLLRAGYGVLTFDDPRDALEEMSGGLRPDVIISDIQMPALDGFGFYERAREQPELRGIPFLFLTALGDRASMRKGMALGADDYLTKPFQPEELTGAVEVRLRRVAELRRPLEGIIAVTGFGHPRVQRDGGRLDWESLKALELLFYLLEHRGGATTFEVAEALWPGKTEAKASSSFHTTLYRLRKVMGGEIVESANRRYYLQDKFTIEYDVDEYRALAKRARGSRLPADYVAAVERYAGHFLTGMEGAWLEDARAALQAEQLALLHAAAESATELGDLDLATSLYHRMTEHEPYSDIAWEGLAGAWEARGERHRAHEARERFALLMAEG